MEARQAGSASVAGTVRYSLRLPAEMHAQLVALAKREGRSLHAQILYLLRQALDKEVPR